MVQQIKDSSLLWRDRAPVSPDFDDIYYSADNGLAESHFVFIEGIGAPSVWENKDSFIIAETGFGTGLNFLATWKAWEASGQQGRLTFISTEAYPLSRAALMETHKNFPEIEAYGQELASSWPPPTAGFYSLSFAEGKIQLLLLFGLAEETLPQLTAEVDAWYLDGFAPAKNPTMWAGPVLDQIARLSKPETRFATFTAAGFVKRGLRERGFNVQKAVGYGRKRERLVGTMQERPALQQPHDWRHIPIRQTVPKSCIIIGGGIAGHCVAAALKKRGVTPILITDSKTTRSVPSALITPALQRNDEPAHQFTIATYAYAAGFAPYHGAWCPKRGAEVVGVSDEDIQKHLSCADFLKWPKEWLIPLKNGYHLPASGSLDTQKTLSTLAVGITTIDATVLSTKFKDAKWHIETTQGTYSAPACIIAAGVKSNQLIGTEKTLPIRPKAGQVEQFRASDSALPDKNVSFGGYITAAHEINGNLQQTLGSTYETMSPTPNATRSQNLILSKYHSFSGGLTPNMEAHMGSWRGIRATMPDHMPLVGPVPDWEAAKEQFAPLSKDALLPGRGPMPYQQGLYIMSSFGSKGFQQAPLAAEYLASLICDTVHVFSAPVKAALHPARFMIKDIIRKVP